MVRSKLHSFVDTSIATFEREAILNLHFVLPRSDAHGPGTRTVIWVQGCTLGCAGCCSQGTHASCAGSLKPVDDLVKMLERSEGEIQGVTISGGEPMQQPEQLLAFLEALRARTSLSVVLSTGYELAEIHGQPLGPKILDFVDVVIAGRFDRTQPLECSLIGSANRRVYLLTERYSSGEIADAVERVL
jgi:anaerobic ribonucleoside-triphosphate reductase activating protein